MTSNELKTVYAGRHLSMVRRGRWEFAVRNSHRPVVGIVAITNEDRIVLVEQFRPPVNQRVIELPAGLVGDIEGSEDEQLLDAAKRELWEETGYEATFWNRLGDGFSSPGLTDESVALFLAKGLKKVADGGGDDTEAISVHEVPRRDIGGWLEKHTRQIDLKLLAGLYALEQFERT